MAGQRLISFSMDTFVYSYYDKDLVMEDDTELQAWFLEASTTAEVINFPCAPLPDGPCNRDTLIDLLTHTLTLLVLFTMLSILVISSHA